MNVIFLDFDGVLNHQLWYKRRMDEVDTESIVSKYPFYEFDPESIKRLNRIVKETNSKIVVSSSWRIGQTPLSLQKL
jgi:histidinol phosphatase-like enzyme